MVAPCYSYTEVAEALGKVAISNIAKATTGRAKAEIAKKVDAVAGKVLQNAPAPAQKAFDGLKKKLFR